MATGEAAQPSWTELMGSNNWDGLLDPLDLSLRIFILRCGDLIQATYDAFNNDQNSKYCGSSRYGKSDFFRKVLLENASDYQVFSFLYGTARVSFPQGLLVHSLSRESWDSESNWIGYIAVTSDERSKAIGRREIYVAWRGTIRNYEWIDVLDSKMESVRSLLNKSNGAVLEENTRRSDNDDDEEMPKVMQGWLTIYTSDNPESPFTKLSARTQLLKKIKELRERYPDEQLSIILTGHSLGSSLSILSAFDLAENCVTDIPVTAIVFGCPQVGNKAFNDRVKNHPNVKILQVRNKIDLIPHYPGKLFGYVDTGTELLIDTRKSPSLKDSKNPSDWHNLQAMLHIVAGWNGENGEFELKVKRSLALVNKSCEYLKEELLVPGSWWVEKNKGMVINADGEWGMASPAEQDLPVPEF